MSSRFIIGLKSGNRRITFRKLKTRAPDLNAGWTAEQISEHIDKLWQELRWWLTEEYHSFRGFVIATMSREADTGPEPGQPIGTSTCPCCGAHLEIEHGDEEGQIAVVGTLSTETAVALVTPVQASTRKLRTRWSLEEE